VCDAQKFSTEEEADAFLMIESSEYGFEGSQSPEARRSGGFDFLDFAIK